MKKFVSVLLVCVALVLVLDVNGTLALEQAAQSLFKQVVSLLGNENGNPEADENNFKVELVITDKNENSNIDRNQVLAPSYEIDGVPTADSDGLWYQVGVVDRFVSAKNESTSKYGAYLRIAIAVKNNDCVYLNFNTSSTDFDRVEKEITIGSDKYTMYVFTYKHELAPGFTTPPTLKQIAMDKDATSADLQALGSDFLQIKVLAIQASAFKKDENGQQVQMSYADALDVALPIDTLNPFQ